VFLLQDHPPLRSGNLGHEKGSIWIGEVSLKYMRHDDKAGAKKSERDCYVEHGINAQVRVRLFPFR
jgi:hypothetical protein